MGKKGSWITALKKAFTSNPKEKSPNVQLVAAQSFPQAAPHRSDKKQRWGFGRSRPRAAEMSGIPLYRQPSSIEKILGDAEMEHQSGHYYGRAQYQIAPAKPATTVLTAAAHGSSATAPTKPAAREREREREWERDDGYNKHAAVLPLPPPPSSPPPLIRRFDHDREQQQRQKQSRADTAEWRQQQTHPRRLPVPVPMSMPPPRTARAAASTTRQRAALTPDRARAAAVAIQAAFRGYSARRSYRSLRGLIRLQAVVRGPSVRRQTAHAMRCMQTLVRVQAQVRASRVEAMERRNGRHSSQYLRDAAGRWRNGSQDGGMWDDSLLSRDEAESRTKRRAEAVTKRERALAYAYSHQVLKATPMAAHAILADLQSGRSPWWWAPIDRSYEPEYPRRIEPIMRPRPVPTMAHRDTMPTPMMTQTTTAATTPARSVASAYSKPSSRPARVARGGAAPSASVHGGGGGGGSIRDDESLTSCPAFGVPNYMTPTLSASAKARARAHVLQEQLRKEQRAAEQKPRFSFGLGQSIGSWAKSPFWKAGGGGGQQQPSSSRVGTPAASVAGGGRHRRSVSGLSVDSTVSMPAGLGRRSFK